jgi:tetratricopeptide (TPR) repeat protein
VHGDLRESQEESERGYQRFRTSDVESAWKFKTLEAETLLWRGDYPEVLKQLAAPLPPTAPPDALIQVLTLKAIAHARQFDGDQAEKEFTEAERLCAITPHPSCGKLFQGRGLVALGHNEFPPARQFLRRSLSFARANGDKFLEATSLLNLGAASLKEEHFDEAIDWSHDAYDVATALTARDIALVAVLNIGWAYYRLGDSERALEMSLEAENRADELGDSFNRENAITNAGYVFMDRRDFSRAEKSFRQALDLAEAEHSKEHSFNALRVLALASVRSGNVEDARKYADQAISIARSGDNHLDELYPLLVKGLAAAQSRDDAEAERIFHEVGQDKLCPVFLQWEVEHSLARLYEDEGRADAADREYRAALATFEAARSPLRRNDSKLPFSNNASRIYDDYVHFLVARTTPCAGPTTAALAPCPKDWVCWQRELRVALRHSTLSRSHGEPMAQFFFIGWARSSRTCGRSRRRRQTCSHFLPARRSMRRCSGIARLSSDRKTFSNRPTRMAAGSTAR